MKRLIDCNPKIVSNVQELLTLCGNPRPEGDTINIDTMDVQALRLLSMVVRTIAKEALGSM